MPDWTRRSAIGALGAAAFIPDALAEKPPAVVPSIPIWLAENDRVFAQAKINGEDVAIMIDNGPVGILLSRAFARERGLESPKGRTASGLSVSSKGGQTLLLGPLKVGFDAALVDLSAVPFEGRPFTALIGQPVLAMARMLFDFDTGALWLQKRGKKPDVEPSSGMTMIPVAQPKGQPFPLIDVVIDGVPLKAEIRFGANSPLSVTDGPMREKWLVPGRPWSTYGSFTQGITSSSESKNIITTVPTVVIGPHTLRDVPLSIEAPEPGRPSPADGGPRVTIGMQALSRFAMFYDAHDVRLGLKPGARMQKKWIKSFIGLGTKEDHGKLIVMHVSENGPAAEAGFKQGEEVTAINGGPATHAAVDGIKPGDKPEFTLADGTLRTIEAREFY